MENKNDKCTMVIAYYKEKNNMPLSKTEKKLYANLLNTYGLVNELNDVRDVETYLLENNYLIKRKDDIYTVSEIGRNSFENKRFQSEHKGRIMVDAKFILTILSFAMSMLALMLNAYNK
jgi:hypothetical protein